MKLLIDANISYRVVKELEQTFPESRHVRDFGLECSGDEVIWSFAKNNGFTIVSKDSDFRHYSFFYGSPPKVISILRGDASTDQLVALLLNEFERIKNFASNQEQGFLVIK